MALVAANVLSIVKAALQNIHGEGKIEAGISDYYLDLANGIQGCHGGMMTNIPTTEWVISSQITKAQLCSTLTPWLLKLISRP